MTKQIKIVLFLALFFSSFAYANEGEKSGFLTTKWCAERGMFADCRVETIFCGYENCHKEQKEFNNEVKGQIVLVVHDEGKNYTVEFKHNIEMGEVLEKAINKNEVTLIGDIHGDKIIVSEFEAPPPPKKSFFKGCL